MGSLFKGLKPENLWNHFGKILEIPHGSGDEKALGEYIISVAKKNNLSWSKDETGNVVVSKAGTAGLQKTDGVILQGHLDMVTEKNSDVAHDFSKDSIQAEIKGGWIQAKGTTLGADNGIGVAAALALMEDKSVKHPPLEFLFTVDEETGLTGATRLTPGFLKGKKLLNLDSEEEGSFTIGCAGGADSEISLSVQKGKSKGDGLFRLKVFGLRGGHSGLDINQGRGNAIKFLARMLWQASNAAPFEIVNIEGGNKRNAIPREAWADIIINSSQHKELKELFSRSFEKLANEFKAVETEVKFIFEKSESGTAGVLTRKSQRTLLNFLLTLPHGVISIHPEMKDLVETSTNLAIIHLHEDHAEIVCSSRSSVSSALEATRNGIAALCELADAEVTQPEGYPGWTPNLQSPLLKTLKEVYKKTFQKTPEVGAVHAGLECGIIGEKFPGMDMISFGPTIEHPHSPEERVHVESVEKFWTFLTAALENLDSKKRTS